MLRCACAQCICSALLRAGRSGSGRRSAEVDGLAHQHFVPPRQRPHASPLQPARPLSARPRSEKRARSHAAMHVHIMQLWAEGAGSCAAAFPAISTIRSCSSDHPSSSSPAGAGASLSLALASRKGVGAALFPALESCTLLSAASPLRAAGVLRTGPAAPGALWVWGGGGGGLCERSHASLDPSDTPSSSSLRADHESESSSIRGQDPAAHTRNAWPWVVEHRKICRDSIPSLDPSKTGRLSESDSTEDPVMVSPDALACEPGVAEIPRG
eukprot:124328-Rhodomonas_salina.2